MIWTHGVLHYSWKPDLVSVVYEKNLPEKENLVAMPSNNAMTYFDFFSVIGGLVTYCKD
jgi:hypothetical protein